VEGDVLTVVLGFSFLRNAFALFSSIHFPTPLLKREEQNPVSCEVFALLSKTADACLSTDPLTELLIRGNLYKIFHGLFRLLSSSEVAFSKSTNPRPLKNVDRALELIRFDYRSAISVDQAAALTGYSKSNFCKVFREITGEGFHAALNRQRIEVASELLCASDLSISEISDAVGFSETKAFCRIFKALKGISPGAYRKRQKT
jgi:AraC-like DNA-binding protein